MQILSVCLYLLALLFCYLVSPGAELLLTMLAALFHEAGHVAALCFCGAGVEKITLTPCGFVIKTKRKCTGLFKKLFVYLSGPAVNLALFTSFCALSGNLYIFALCNLLLFFVNVLPVRSLDGGEALAEALSYVLPPEKSEKISRITSLSVIILLWIPASYIFMLSGVNCSLFLISVFLFVKIFLSK